mmetsp:Transcript_27148/g.67291  ORF Transcript_27148/g.67291 Transcript_27148/m.67291 type:complete len:184 (-) Transcript_27148:283-834(-)
MGFQVISVQMQRRMKTEAFNVHKQLVGSKSPNPPHCTVLLVQRGMRDYLHARCSRRGRRELDESSEHHVVSNLTTTTPDRAPSRRCGARRKFEKHHAPGTQASQLLPCPALPPSNAVASKVATSRQISARKSNCSKASIEAATSRTPSERWFSRMENTHASVVRRPIKIWEALEIVSEACMPI